MRRKNQNKIGRRLNQRLIDAFIAVKRQLIYSTVLRRLTAMKEFSSPSLP